tara:strand:+ start:120 stop:863 length:744 start_codon:yes stop_codon:yes gene_type:complete
MRIISSALFAVGLTLSGSAFAKDAAAILAKLDANMNQSEDQLLEWEVTSQEPGKKTPREMAFSVQLKGEKTLTEFNAPGDIKGTRVLVLSRSQMYIYLPQFRKVRRIASHVTQQGFMGTTYSHADMSASRFGDVYTGAVKSETAEQWVLELTPIPDKEAPYPKVEMTITKEKHLPKELKYFNDNGEHIKTETRDGYDCQGTICNPTLLRMTDHTRNGAWTELRCTSWKANVGLGDDIFTPRTLQRGG